MRSPSSQSCMHTVANRIMRSQRCATEAPVQAVVPAVNSHGLTGCSTCWHSPGLMTVGGLGFTPECHHMMVMLIMLKA